MAMSDAAVEAKTGKDWAGWFGALDRAGAASLQHREIARLLHDSERGTWRKALDKLAAIAAA